MNYARFHKSGHIRMYVCMSKHVHTTHAQNAHTYSIHACVHMHKHTIYHRSGTFDGDFNLAVWAIVTTNTTIKRAPYESVFIGNPWPIRQGKYLSICTCVCHQKLPNIMFTKYTTPMEHVHHTDVK